MRRAPAALAALLALGGCGGAAVHHRTLALTVAGGAPRTPTSAPTPSRAYPVAPRPWPHETLAVSLRGPLALRAAPASQRVLARLGWDTEFGSPQVLPVVRRRGFWLGVLASQLGNGTVGWVRSSSVDLLREQWSISVSLSGRRARLRRLGRTVLEFPVAVGAPAHPTPVGRYGVTDRLRTGGPHSPYGCCVLALTGHQPHVPQGWSGGDRLAIHGTSDPASVGAAVSTGCLRASTAALHVLMRRVPLGTPVYVRR
jgi:L,D-transpeptidase catalytic domain